MKKVVIYINNCPVHLLQQVAFNIEKFVTNYQYEIVETITDADFFIIVMPVKDKMVFMIDNTKLRGTQNFIVDM